MSSFVFAYVAKITNYEKTQLCWPLCTRKFEQYQQRPCKVWGADANKFKYKRSRSQLESPIFSSTWRRLWAPCWKSYTTTYIRHASKRYDVVAINCHSMWIWYFSFFTNSIFLHNLQFVQVGFKSIWQFDPSILMCMWTELFFHLLTCFTYMAFVLA